MVSYHNKLEIKDTNDIHYRYGGSIPSKAQIWSLQLSWQSGGLWLLRSWVQIPSFSRNKLMEQWQMWSLRRTENPKELDRNQPAPHKCSDGEVGNALVCKTNIRQFESDSGLKICPCGENGQTQQIQNLPLKYT